MKRALMVALILGQVGHPALAKSGASTVVSGGDGSCDPVSTILKRAPSPDKATSRRLAALYAADQAAREHMATIDWNTVVSQDRAHRLEAERLIQAGKLFSAADFYHAAMLFQHGNCPAHYRHAQALAEQAFRLGSRPARWLYAAATDRWLRSQKLSQKFGTQYSCNGTKGQLEPYDPKTTDAERARYDVPPLKTALERAGTICR